MYFALGVCYVGRYFGPIINIAEYSDERWRTFVSTYILVADQTCIILVDLYFKYVPRGNHSSLEIGGIILNLLVLIGLYWVPESPEYLYGMFEFD